MLNIKKDFPIFRNNPGLVFLDSAASTQKPYEVIDGIRNFLENDYANIHRGSYDLSHRSEKLYAQSKLQVLKSIGAKNAQVVYTYNSTYAFNLLAHSLIETGYLKAGDKIILSVAEHNSNIIPWQIIARKFGIKIEYLGLDKNYDYDFTEFKRIYDSSVKVVSLNHVSNVTGKIFSLDKIRNHISKDTFFVVDGSQSVPNFFVDFDAIGADFLVFTGHKVMADSGIGVLVGKKDILGNMESGFGGGGTVSHVTKKNYESVKNESRFEPGTPNLSGAVSILKAFEYIESIGGFQEIREHEKFLNMQFLQGFQKLGTKVKVIGPKDIYTRTAVFSFLVDGYRPIDIGEILAENNICVRTGGHCAHILIDELDIERGTCRASGYAYNTKDDLDKFFDVLNYLIKK